MWKLFCCLCTFELIVWPARFGPQVQGRVPNLWLRVCVTELGHFCCHCGDTEHNAKDSKVWCKMGTGLVLLKLVRTRK
jgi:hypothetical protein